MAVDSLFLIIHFSNTLIDEDLCDLFCLLLFASSSLSSLLKKFVVDFVVIGCVVIMNVMIMMP